MTKRGQVLGGKATGVRVDDIAGPLVHQSPLLRMDLTRQIATLLCPGEPNVSNRELAARLRDLAARLEEEKTVSAHVPAACDGNAHDDVTGACDAIDDAVDGACTHKGPPGFDISRYPHRLIALDIFYAGWPYHGFATQGCVSSS